MNRRTLSLPACTAALLLCASLQPAHATGRWATLTPLLAGTYSGNCEARPATEGGTKGSIHVAANGKVRAPGIDIDVADSAIVNVERRRIAQGTATTVALVSADQQKSLAVGRVEGEALAQTREGPRSFNCTGVRLPAALDKQALAVTLAGTLDTAGTIECRAAPDDKPRQTSFALSRGRATLGQHALDLSAATDELLTRGPDGILKYHAELPDGRTFIAYYDETGKVKNVVILDRGKDVVGCGLKD